MGPSHSRVPACNQYIREASSQSTALLRTHDVSRSQSLRGVSLCQGQGVRHSPEGMPPEEAFYLRSGSPTGPVQRAMQPSLDCGSLPGVADQRGKASQGDRGRMDSVPRAQSGNSYKG